MNIDSAKAQDLWNQYARDQALDVKNELILHYMYLVKSIVFRMMPTFEGYSNYDDLLSCGVLGLIDAINKYDINRDVKFEYYASMRIKGEIIDYIRRQDWAPSSLRRKIQQVANAFNDLEKQLFRTPTDTEVAKYLGMEEEELHKIISKSHMFNIVHFEEMLMEDFSVGDTIKDQGDTPESHLDGKETVKLLGDFIQTLPEKERLVVTLYYYEELTMKEIAGVLGVSESRTSQIHSKAILKLRAKMNNAIHS